LSRHLDDFERQATAITSFAAYCALREQHAAVSVIPSSLARKIASRLKMDKRTVRYLGVEVDDALVLSEQVDV